MKIQIRNSSGNTVRVKVNRIFKNINPNKTERFELDSLFTTKIEVFYQNKEVASTSIKPGSPLTRFRIYKEKGSWFIQPEKF